MNERLDHLDVAITPDLQLPLSPYVVEGYSFGQRVRSRMVLWARHLGDDLIVDAGMSVRCIGDGVVVWSEVRLGSEEKRNWGGLVVVAHRHVETEQVFYSLYGHISDVQVRVDQKVRLGDVIGSVAKGSSPENGWWKIPHLHFGVYVGPWQEEVLPGYARPFEGRTKFAWWRNPKDYIETYGKLAG